MPQVDSQMLLRLMEKSKSIAFVDIEATGLRGDYNSVLCVSIKPYGSKPYSVSVLQPGNDQRVVRDAKRILEGYDCWVTYYGKGFDLPMLNTRLLRWGQAPISKRLHIDMYYTLKYNLLMARRSQGHLLSWLGTPQQKMGVSAEVWNKIIADPAGQMSTMISRCESDVRGLEGLYNKTKHVIADIKR